MAQLSLSERSTLANKESFRSRVFQGLFSKANFHASLSNPANLKAQKQQEYARPFLKGGANSIDIYAVVRFWLSNYNVDPAELNAELEPTDSAILDTSALDIVYDSLAGVNAGDQNLPVAG